LVLLRFDEQVVVITGAGHGLGRSYARLLAARGAKVVVNDLGGGIDGAPPEPGAQSPAQDVVDEILAAGGHAVASGHDISDEESARACVQLALDTFGRVDGVINNAGINPSAPFVLTPRAVFEKVLAVHLLGAWSVTQAAWPHFVEQGYGRVLNTCSGAMYQGHGTRATYSAAKGALYGLTRDLAVEGGDHGIKVNGLCPGALTRMMADSRPEVRARAAAWTPDAVANVVTVLMHRDCPVNGEVIESRGGQVHRIFMAIAPGVVLDTDSMTPEDVAAQMDTVLDPGVPIEVGALIDHRGPR
jgi:NAD(P)-dependent dehydrogenase (short-subunit alcohol dehydrogenase family)